MICALSLCLLVLNLVSPCFSENPSIGIVDEKAFHLEVVGGLMHVLEPYAATTTVYLHPLNFPDRPVDFGFVDTIKRQKAQIRGLPVLSMPHHDILIFVSPEYRIDYVRELIERSQPKAVIALIHNGDAEGLVYMKQLHPNVHLFTLSPHVATFAGARIGASLDWMLPLVGHKTRLPCKDEELRTCLAGFAIQGNMDSRRRNYTLIWDQLDERLNASEDLRRDDRFKINVVGSGCPSKLEVPLRLEQRVRPHVNLRFDDFYDLIHHNFALIPTLASESYFDRKFSSTVITSLATGVPIIVTKRFLESYTFLSKDSVWLQIDGEEAIDAAIRLLHLPVDQLAALRNGIGQLRENLNQRAAGQIQEIIDKSKDLPGAGPLPWTQPG